MGFEGGGLGLGVWGNGFGASGFIIVSIPVTRSVGCISLPARRRDDSSLAPSREKVGFRV